MTSLVLGRLLTRTAMARLAAIALLLAIWEIAARGWQDRIQGNHAVARRFNQFYREAWA